MIPATLVMAITAPLALTTQGIWFAAAYLVVQLWVLGLQSLDAWKSEVTRKAFMRYAPLATVAPMMLLVGAFFHGNVRLWIWVGVAALFVGSALLAAAGDGTEWKIDAVHFAERHALFVIICLGEVLVAIGATAASISASAGLDGHTFAALMVAAALACLYWWTYFAFVPRVLEHRLATTSGQRRGKVARDLCSFGHFPIVLGIILVAIVAKHLVQHNTGHLAVEDRWLMIASASLFIGGMLHIQWRVVHRLSPERLAALAAIGCLVSLGGALPGVVTLALVAVTIGVMSTITWRKFNNSEFGRAVQNG